MRSSFIHLNYSQRCHREGGITHSSVLMSAASVPDEERQKLPLRSSVNLTLQVLEGRRSLWENLGHTAVRRNWGGLPATSLTAVSTILHCTWFIACV